MENLGGTVKFKIHESLLFEINQKVNYYFIDYF